MLSLLVGGSLRPGWLLGFSTNFLRLWSSIPSVTVFDLCKEFFTVIVKSLTGYFIVAIFEIGAAYHTI